MKKKILLTFSLVAIVSATCYAKHVVQVLTSCGELAVVDVDRFNSPEDFEAQLILIDQTLCPENWDIDSF